jgi:hypothetical protein
MPTGSCKPRVQPAGVADHLDANPSTAAHVACDLAEGGCLDNEHVTTLPPGRTHRGSRSRLVPNAHRCGLERRPQFVVSNGLVGACGASSRRRKARSSAGPSACRHRAVAIGAGRRQPTERGRGPGLTMATRPALCDRLHNDRVDVFDGEPGEHPGRSSIRSMPDGFAPFGMKTTASDPRHVREARRGGHDDVGGQGAASSTCTTRAARSSAGSHSGTQLTVGPRDGSGDSTLRRRPPVGNFGDGEINAYGAAERQLRHRGEFRRRCTVSRADRLCAQFGKAAANNGPARHASSPPAARGRRPLRRFAWVDRSHRGGAMPWPHPISGSRGRVRERRVDALGPTDREDATHLR